MHSMMLKVTNYVHTLNQCDVMHIHMHMHAHHTHTVNPSSYS